MQVTDELRHLESFFEDEHRRFTDTGKGRSMVELYETVQHAGNIIPRLFLLITVGAVYIRTKEVRRARGCCGAQSFGRGWALHSIAAPH